MNDTGRIRPARGILFAGALLWNMCNGMLFVLTPLFGVTLGLSVLDIGSLVGLPYLLTIVMRFVGGALADRYGEHRMLQACYSLNVLAAVTLALASGFLSLMLSSTLANLSRSMFWVPAQSMASQLSSRYPGRMLGQLSAANYIGQLLGLALGGVLAGWLGYGYTFALVTLASVVGMLLGFVLPPIRVHGGRTVWETTMGMSRRLLQGRTWLLISTSCAAAVPFGITQSIYPVYMSDLAFPEGWISVIIAVRSIGPVVIGLALGSEITIEREKGFYALSMAGLGLFILATTWTQGWLLLGLCIAGLGMAGAVADLLNQVQAVDLSRASDRSAVMAATGLGWNMSPMALPLVLGWAADTWGFALMFAGAGVFFLLVVLGTPLWYRLLR